MQFLLCVDWNSKQASDSYFMSGIDNFDKNDLSFQNLKLYERRYTVKQTDFWFGIVQQYSVKTLTANKNKMGLH